jgi:hypothetical protein
LARPEVTLSNPRRLGDLPAFTSTREDFSLSRTQTKAFKELTQRCAEDVIYERMLVLLKQYETVVFHALPIYLSALLRHLQTIGRCLPVDAHNILRLADLGESCKGCETPARERENWDPQYRAAVKSATTDLNALYDSASIRYERLVVIAAMTIALRSLFERLNSVEGGGSAVSESLEYMYKGAFRFPERAD